MYAGLKRSTANQLHAEEKIRSPQQYEELLSVADRLQSMVDYYCGQPSAVDRILLEADTIEADPQEVMIAAYQMVAVRMCADDSPLRRNQDIWDAFNAQQREFFEFYTAAFNSVEIYKELLALYRSHYDTAERQPYGGQLDRIRQEKYICIEERSKCITAISEFHSKLSAMLSVL